MTRKTTPLLWFIFMTFSIAFQACSISGKGTKKMLARSRTVPPYDLVVVPGVPLENGKWSRTMKARVYWSKYLYDQGIARNIMYSGSAVYTSYYEARVMALYAEAIGIPKEHIFTEIRAEHSTENIYYSYKKARKLGFRRIALATDPFQSRSLKGFIWNKVSHDIDAVPIVFDTLKMMEITMTDPVIDFQPAFADNFVSLPDRESWLKRFWGTRGRNLDVTAYDELIQAKPRE